MVLSPQLTLHPLLPPEPTTWLLKVPLMLPLDQLSPTVLDMVMVLLPQDQ